MTWAGSELLEVCSKHPDNIASEGDYILVLEAFNTPSAGLLPQYAMTIMNTALRQSKVYSPLIWGSAASPGWPGAVLLDAGTVYMNATVGWQVITGLTFTVTHPRWLWTHVKCVAYTASPTVQCLDGIGSAGSSPRIPGWPVYGALPGRAFVGAYSAINSGSAGVLTAAGPVGPNSVTQVGLTQTAPLIVLRRSS